MYLNLLKMKKIIFLLLLFFHIGLLGGVGITSLLELESLSEINQLLNPIISVIAPYLLLSLIGTIIGLLEILTTFNNRLNEALRSKWTIGLIVLNATGACFPYWVLNSYLPTNQENSIQMIVAMGFGFPVIIRSRFVIIKPFSFETEQEQKDLAIDLGRFYDKFQEVFKKQIDRDLLPERASLIDQLKETLSPQMIRDLALKTIWALNTLSEDEKLHYENKINETFQKLSIEKAHAKMAIFVLDLAGVEQIKELIEKEKYRQDSERLSRKLDRKFPNLKDLVNFAILILDSGKQRNYVLRVCRDNEESQQIHLSKSTIIFFLVKNVNHPYLESKLDENDY